MKKTIFILAILTVLLFTGCDAMLEIFYPELTDSNEVTIIISITTTDISNYGYNTNKPLYIELYKTGENPTSNTPVKSVKIYNQFDYTATISVSEGTFDVYIWQDSDDGGSYGGMDFTLSTVPSKTLTGTDNSWSYTATSWTNTGA